jgi:hypothetical protein
MALDNCSFETDRLVVDDWSRVLTGEAAEAMRDSFVVSLLTEAVTRHLRPGWQGPFDTSRTEEELRQGRRRPETPIRPDTIRWRHACPGLTS